MANRATRAAMVRADRAAVLARLAAGDGESARLARVAIDALAAEAAAAWGPDYDPFGWRAMGAAGAAIRGLRRLGLTIPRVWVRGR